MVERFGTSVGMFRNQMLLQKDRLEESQATINADVLGFEKMLKEKKNKWSDNVVNDF